MARLNIQQKQQLFISRELRNENVKAGFINRHVTQPWSFYVKPQQLRNVFAKRICKTLHTTKTTRIFEDEATKFHNSFTLRAPHFCKINVYSNRNYVRDSKTA